MKTVLIGIGLKIILVIVLWILYFIFKEDLNLWTSKPISAIKISDALWLIIILVLYNRVMK